jgi:hypothetical protein
MGNKNKPTAKENLNSGNGSSVGDEAPRAPADLPRLWRTKAADFKLHALEAIAAAYELLASQLEQALEQHWDEPLNLRQAHAEGGYSEGHLGRLLATGALPNAGRKHAPRVLRRHVPVKTGHLANRSANAQLVGASRSQIARSIVNPKRGTR